MPRMRCPGIQAGACDFGHAVDSVPGCQAQRRALGREVQDEILETVMPAQIRVVRPAMTEIIEPAIRKRYAYPRYALAFDVPAVAGGSTSRSADAVAVGLTWETGHVVTGFVFRSCRENLEHELGNLAKAEAVKRYCDYWYLVVPEPVAKEAAVPDDWGLMSVAWQGDLRPVKQAPELPRLSWPREFAAGFAKAACRP